MSAPLFDADMRQFFREFANSITDYGTTVQLRAVNRRPDGSIIRDRNGNATYAAPTTHNALVIWEQQLVATTNNEQRTAKGVATFSFPAPIVTVDDRIIIDGIERAIVAVSADDSTDPMLPTKVYV